MTSARRRGIRWLFVPTQLGWAAAGLGVVCLASEPAGAAEAKSTIELVWTAPPSCPKREQVLAKSEQLLHGQAERAVSAEGTIQTHPDGFELVLRAEAEGVELSRRLVAPRCDELADAAALIVAMAARPEQHGSAEAEIAASSPARVSGGRGTRETPSRKAAQRGAPVARRPAAEPPVPAQSPPTRPYAMATGAADSGTLPSSTLALGVGVGVWRGPLGAEAQIRHWFKRQWDMSSARKGVVLWLNAGSFLGCLGGPLGTAACGGLEIGSLSGRGYGVDESNPRSVVWAAGLASARLRLVPARWLWLAASFEAAVPIKRYEFELMRVDGVHRPADVCLRAGVQAGVVFGSRK